MRDKWELPIIGHIVVVYKKSPNFLDKNAARAYNINYTPKNFLQKVGEVNGYGKIAFTMLGHFAWGALDNPNASGLGAGQ